MLKTRNGQEDQRVPLLDKIDISSALADKIAFLHGKTLMNQLHDTHHIRVSRCMLRIRLLKARL